MGEGLHEKYKIASQYWKYADGSWETIFYVSVNEEHRGFFCKGRRPALSIVKAYLKGTRLYASSIS